jgi:GxxExxY protein
VTTPLNEVSAAVIAHAIDIHRGLGPGLLESVYETVLAAALERSGWHVVRQRAVDLEYAGLHFPGAFKLDLLVDDRLIVEIKSVETLTKAHAKQLLTYLRLTKQPLGLLLNFNEATMKDGIRRLVNEFAESA